MTAAPTTAGIATPGMAAAGPGTPAGGTFVAFHAHPDDEAIFTGGTLALAGRAGWRTVVVFATGGELGAAAALESGPWTCAGWLHDTPGPSPDPAR